MVNRIRGHAIHVTMIHPWIPILIIDLKEPIVVLGAEKTEVRPLRTHEPYSIT